MPSPSQIATQFADVKQLLDQCLEHGGGAFTAKSSGAAVHFRQRAYTFRKKYREAMDPAASPYDRLTIKKLAKGASRVEIEVIKLDGVFEPGTGGPVRVDPIPDLAGDDELMRAALALREKLDLD